MTATLIVTSQELVQAARWPSRLAKDQVVSRLWVQTVAPFVIQLPEYGGPHATTLVGQPRVNQGGQRAIRPKSWRFLPRFAQSIRESETRHGCSRRTARRGTTLD